MHVVTTSSAVQIYWPHKDARARAGISIPVLSPVITLIAYPPNRLARQTSTGDVVAVTMN